MPHRPAVARHRADTRERIVIGTWIAEVVTEGEPHVLRNWRHDPARHHRPARHGSDLIGNLLIVLGLGALAYQGFSCRTREKILDVVTPRGHEGHHEDGSRPAHRWRTRGDRWGRDRRRVAGSRRDRVRGCRAARLRAEVRRP